MEDVSRPAQDHQWRSRPKKKPVCGRLKTRTGFGHGDSPSYHLRAMSRYLTYERNGTFALISADDGHGPPFRQGLQAMNVYGESRAV
jgi:hypothetical protein